MTVRSPIPSVQLWGDNHNFDNDACVCAVLWLRNLEDQAEEEWLNYEDGPWNDA